MKKAILLTILLTTLVSCYRENIYDCYFLETDLRRIKANQHMRQ